MCTRPGRGRGAGRGLPLLLAGTLFLMPRAPHPGSHPILLSIMFSGNASVSSSELRDALPLRRGDALTDSAVGRAVSAVVAFYRGRSFFGATATGSCVDLSGDSSAADLLITVREGLRATIKRVAFRGVESLREERLASAVGTAPGDPLTPDRLEEALSAILAEYERSGFPFARASVAEIADEGGGAMAVTFGVEEGGRVAIGEIRVEGNTETNSGVIVRESRMDLPEPYEPGKVSGYAQRLRRLGLFSSVEEPSLYTTPAGYGLLVRVREGRTSTFDGVVGYAPPLPAEASGTLTGSATVAFRNLFGTGRRLEAGWSRYARSTQEIRLAYEEPWAFGFPLNLGGGFSQRQQDTSFVDRRVSASVEFLASASFTIAAVGERKEIIPSSGPGGRGIPGSSSATGGIAVRYDTRDDRVLPTRGVNYRSEYRTGTRKPTGAAPGSASASVSHLGLDFDLFVPVRKNHVLDLSVHGWEVSTDSPQPGDLYRLGGFRTLRGFREDRFSGTRVAWGTAEYRIVVEGNNYFFGFIDPGYVAQAPAPGELFTYGYGIGMRLDTGLGLIGVSFALGRGDPVSETKIHFGLVNDF